MKKILVITKYRFIGDTLTAIPAIRALKEKWPDSKVTLLTGARACELLQNSPYVDDFIEFDPYRSSDQGLKAYLSLIAKLRRERFDLALVLNRSFHSALTAALGGSRKRCGWKGFEGRDFLLTDLCVYDKEKPEIDCFLDVYRLASWSEPKQKHLELWLTENELSAAAQKLRHGRRIIGIQPGATHNYKQWPITNFLQLAEELVRKEPGTQFVLIGGPEERSIAEEFMSNASLGLAERTTNLVGKLTLRMTLAIVSQINLFVGNDTAIRHASVALDTPSIAIFGPTSWTKWGNASPPLHNIVWSPTGKMEDVTVDEILGVIETIHYSELTTDKSQRSAKTLGLSNLGVKV